MRLPYNSSIFLDQLTASDYKEFRILEFISWSVLAGLCLAIIIEARLSKTGLLDWLVRTLTGGSVCICGSAGV